MPTKEEIDLYVNNDAGGSGDPAHDELVSRKLRKLFEVPETNVKAFVKTRDRHSVHKIEEALRDVPGVYTGSELGRSVSAPSLPSAAFGAAASSSSPSSPKAPGSKAKSPSSQRHLDMDRINAMMEWTSTYCSAYSPGGKQAYSTPPPHADLFKELVKPGRHDEFGSWRKHAPEHHVRSLGDACRAFKYFGQGGMHNTTYKIQYHPHDLTACRPAIKPRKVQESTVPIGSSGQASAEKRKTGQTITQMEAERLRRETDELREKLSTAGSRTSLSLSFPVKVAPTNMKPGEHQGAPAPSGDWRALGKASYTTLQHTKDEVARHEISRLTKGEAARRDHGHAQKMKTLSLEAAARGGDANVFFNVSNPRDPSGLSASRFSFAKYSGKYS